jgi:hypothetical protein
MKWALAFGLCVFFSVIGYAQEDCLIVQPLPSVARAENLPEGSCPIRVGNSCQDRAFRIRLKNRCARAIPVTVRRGVKQEEISLAPLGERELSCLQAKTPCTGILAKRGTKIDQQQPPKRPPTLLDTNRTVVGPPPAAVDQLRNVPTQFCSPYEPQFSAVKTAMMEDRDYPKCRSRCDPLPGTQKESCEIVCYLTTARNAFARAGALCPFLYYEVRGSRGKVITRPEFSTAAQAAGSFRPAVTRTAQPAPIQCQALGSKFGSKAQGELPNVALYCGGNTDELTPCGVFPLQAHKTPLTQGCKCTGVMLPGGPLASDPQKILGCPDLGEWADFSYHVLMRCHQPGRA